MLNKGKYVNINSNIHNMNPLFKLICMILFIIMVFLSKNMEFNLILTCLLIILVLNTSIPIIIYIRIILKMKWFLTFIIIVNILCGVDKSIIILSILRIVYTVLYSSIFIMTTTLNDVTYSLRMLFSPLSFILPVNKIALSISLAINFIPSIFEHSNKIIKSQASRGIDYNYSLKNKVMSLKSLVIPLFNISFKKADDLSDIMELRLYDVNQRRTRYKSNTLIFFDFLMITIHLMLLFYIVVKGVII